jgi:YNFM family putative membrane transporter
MPFFFFMSISALETVPAKAPAAKLFDLTTVAVFLAGACTFLNVYTTQPVLPLLRRVYHASEVEVSLTVSVTTVCIALAAPLFGLLAEKFGRKRVIMPAIFGLTVPTMLAATSTSLHALIVWRALQGLFVPGIAAIMIAYIGEEWAAGGVGAAMAAYVSGTVLGGFLGRFVTGVVAAHWPWQWAFAVIGVINFIGALGVWRWLPRSRNFAPSDSFGAALADARMHLRNLPLLAVFAMGWLVLFSHVGVFTYINFYLAGAPFHLNTAALGSIFFVYLFGMVVTPAAGRFFDRHGFRNTAVVALVFGASGMLLTLTHSLALVIAGLGLFSTGVFISQAAATVQISRVAQGGRSSAAGMYITTYYLGGSFGAVVPGWAFMAGGWPACVALLMTASLGTTVMAFASSGKTGAARGA